MIERNKSTKFKPSLESLPANMSVKVLDNELVITHRQYSGVRQIIIPSAVIFSFLLCGLLPLFVSKLNTEGILCINLLNCFWVGIGYLLLRGVVNTMVVQVTSERLMMKNGPLPPIQNMRINTQHIKQLYVKQRKGKTISYEVCLVTKQGRHEKIVPILETAEQALYLEQEIERFLSIKDIPMPGEYQSLITYDFKDWHKFAQANDLYYTASKSWGGKVSGIYQRYSIELSTVPQTDVTVHTRFTITRTKRAGREKNTKQLSLNDVIDLFEVTLQSKNTLTGTFKALDMGEKITYEQDEIIRYEDHLQFIFEILYQLIAVYPQLTLLGSEIIPILQPIANNRKHPAQIMAIQLIQEIVAITKPMYQTRSVSLLCSRCYCHFVTHKIELSGLKNLSYYGCRKCHQSKNLLIFDKVIAMLDSQVNSEVVQQGRIVIVNWLIFKNLFDFDSVEIIKTTDEDAERFAVQVGNDTNPMRKQRYKQMRCKVSTACGLSENTMRILQRAFGSVEMTEAVGPQR